MSKKKFELVDPSRTFEGIHSSNRVNETDWNLCFICQQETSSKLECPANSRQTDKEVGYVKVADQLKDFSSIGELPESLQVRVESGDLLHSLKEHEAKFHKTCRNKYDSYHYERACKRRKLADRESLPEIGATRATRSRFSAENFRPCCFFCEKEDAESNLSSAQTFALDRRVRDAALLLSDEKLLAKLSEGDLVAIEAKYHKSCLASLYNRVRNATKNDLGKGDEDEIISGVVLAEVIGYIHEIYQTEEGIPVFKLSDLVTLYRNRLKEYGGSNSLIESVHSTRLKENILGHIPELGEYKKGKHVLLTFKEESGQAIFDACAFSNEDDGMCLARAAAIIRKQIIASSKENDAILVPASEGSSVPHSLYSLICMVLNGWNIDEKVPVKEQTAAMSIAQLIKFNTVKTKRRKCTQTDVVRHSKENETPFPLYLGLMLHSKTRKKGLIDNLSRHGLSVSYKRVQSVQLAITKQLCRSYQNQGVFCPPSLKKGIFTSAAIDNIDHNPSSTTAKEAFHGTSISVFQHPEEDIESEIFVLERGIEEMDVKLQLPEYYTAVVSTKTEDAEYPSQSVNPERIGNVEGAHRVANQWLQKVEGIDDANAQIDVKERLSWSGYHSQIAGNRIIRPNCTSTLLPLLEESINSHAMVRHTMDIVVLILRQLCPEQAAVITADQPVYAIAKKVQWSYPELYGENKLVMMMGALHIEMATLNMLGDWLEGSGWVEVLIEAQIHSPGRAESVLSGTHVKRSRYVHQVTCAALHLLLVSAYRNSSTDVPIEEWITARRSSSAQFNYWLTVIELETLLLMLVRSIREGDIHMFVRSLEDIAPWMFALDHVHYARWLPVFINDLKLLPVKHPSIFKEFLKGKFTFQKTKRAFSCLAEDQAHEQNNKIVKIDGGAIGILQDPAALLKWMVAGPEITRMLQSFENEEPQYEDEDNGHHEDSDGQEKKFRKDTIAIKEVFSELGNPFEEDDVLMHVTKKCLMSQEAMQSVREAQRLGKEQYDRYVKERLIMRQVSLYSAIKRNSLPLFREKNKVSTSKGKLRMVSLKEECWLYASLYVACQSRDGDLQDFFTHENHSYPPALSEYGKLRTCTKADFLQPLDAFGSTCLSGPEATAKIIDGAAVVQMTAPRDIKTFGQYASDVFTKAIYKSFQQQGMGRVDVVFDVYLKDSLKSETRERRGSGTRISVRETTPIWGQWQQFLRDDDNKTELFGLLADKLVSHCPPNRMILATSFDRTLCNADIDLTRVSPCNHEEADTRIFVHVKHAADSGHRKIVVKTVDTDVVVLAISLFQSLQIEELWVEFGVGKQLRWLPIHEYVTNLGESVCKGLRFWFAFTGCDTVSSFAGRGKKYSWTVWRSHPDVNETFERYALVFHLCKKYKNIIL